MRTSTPKIDEFYSVALEEGLIKETKRTRFYLDTLFANVNLRGASVLDIGGGSGKFSYYAACNGAEHVTCLEPEVNGSFTGMKALFARMGERLNVKDRVFLEPVPLQDFNAGSRKYDVILLHNSINHLDEDACVKLHASVESQDAYVHVLQRVGELATDGANIVVCDCSRHNFFAAMKIKNPFAPTIEWHKHQTPEMWARLLQRSGFEQPEIRWTSFVPLYSLERFLTSNRVTSYFMASHFCLTMRKRHSVAA